MTTPLRVEFKPSVPAAAVVVAAHIAAAVCAVAALPLVAAIFVVAGLTIAAAAAAGRVLLLDAGAVCELTIDADSKPALRLRSGVWCAANLEDAGMPLPGLIALQFRDDAGRRRSILALPGNVRGEAMRHLRVWAIAACSAAGAEHRTGTETPAVPTLK